MATNRLEILQNMLSQDPNNTFARYGLAMEYAKAEHYEQALAEFRSLLAHDTGYSAAYYHGGQTLEKLGQVEAARKLYQEGIAATTRNGDGHTRSEIEAALDLLPL